MCAAVMPHAIHITPRSRKEAAMYIGPETIMPIASVLAAIGGILMLFWNRTVAYVRGGVRFIRGHVTRLVSRN